MGAPKGCKQRGRASGLIPKNDLVGTGRAISAPEGCKKDGCVWAMGPKEITHLHGCELNAVCKRGLKGF